VLLNKEADGTLHIPLSKCCMWF